MDNIPTHITEGILREEPQLKSLSSPPKLKDRAFWNNVCAVLRETRQTVARLRALQSIDLRSSPAFNQAIHRHIVQYAAHEAVSKKRQNLFRPFLSALFGVPFLIIYGFSFSEEQYTSGEWIILAFSMVASFFILSFLLFVVIQQFLSRYYSLNSIIFFDQRKPDIPWHRIRRDRDREEQKVELSNVNLINYVYIYFPFIFALIYNNFFFDPFLNRFFPHLVEFQRSPVGLNTFLPPFYASEWFWFAIAYLLCFIVMFIPYMSLRQLNARYPQTIICIRLLEALSLLEQYPESWRVASFKEEIVKKLEEAAHRMEFDVPRQLRARDPVTDDWLTQSFTGIARSFREQKKRLLLQELGARKALIEFLARELPHVADGDLGNMARVEEPTPAEQRQGMIRRLVGLLTAVIKGGLPILGLWAFQQSPYAVRSDWVNTLFFIFVLYLMASILREIDPLFTDKIGAMKELIDFSPTK